MSEGNATASGSGGPSKAIASLAKKPTDTTRSGTRKMTFVPTLPVRRKKEEVKQEPATLSAPSTSDRGGRGRGRGRGRGEGRGGAPPRPPPPEMTASGPFAMGPSRAGASGWRSTPRAAPTPIVPMGSGGSAAVGANLTRTAAPTLKKERGEKLVQVEDDAEVYSDPDEGVEIVDMENVRTMDWMAPESLRREREGDKKKKKAAKVKEDEERQAAKAKGVAPADAMEVEDRTPVAEEAGDVNLANALDLSESEDEEEMEDLVEDFAQHDDEIGTGHERLYFFQFPEPFPTFSAKSVPPPDTKGKGKAPEGTAGKRVSFSDDTKPPASTIMPLPEDVDKPQPIEHVDGIIGQLEIYQSGAVKMRLANGILMDVTAATQPSFLQQAVHVDQKKKSLQVLGEVSRRFVVTPNVDTLLAAMTQAEEDARLKFEDENLISMDTT
ncbi:hypothetical protein BV25DRAFT_1858047 [Artomyces pyxidatus]|uniref:Uncharacterized protein n=1 Tax=Artomyces pyxidatus TaxID=48021 RepID=A0ACB8SYM9_9AGAM|nr:hypothetical protein BV25DRAFT_1858047 [Artomyces pyxidatus]